MAAQKHITVSVDTAGYKPAVISADLLTIQKIFLNLLNNAVKYTPDGGHIWVQLRIEQLGQGKLQAEVSIRDNGIGMPGLFRAIERGPHLVEEPRTKRQLEVNAISTIWNEEPAYAVYFYEYQAGTQAEHQEAEQRHKRIVFNNMIFTGSSNDLYFWENGSKAFHVWNLTTNQLVMGEGRSLLEELPRQSLTYELFCRYLLRSVSRESDPAALEQLLQRQRLEMLYESGSYPQKLQLSLETVHAVRKYQKMRNFASFMGRERIVVQDNYFFASKGCLHWEQNMEVFLCR